RGRACAASGRIAVRGMGQRPVLARQLPRPSQVPLPAFQLPVLPDGIRARLCAAGMEPVHVVNPASRVAALAAERRSTSRARRLIADPGGSSMRHVPCLLAAMLGFGIAMPAAAAVDVPASLEPWRAWVLD